MESNSAHIAKLLKNLPAQPGVYLHLDAKGRLLYVGKAKNLKKRVSSYFHGAKDAKTAALAAKIAEVSTIVTQSETEALLLEDSLIKKHKPPYNIDLKDDKRYPYLKLTAEKYPRLIIARQRFSDGGKYFGPYAGSVRDALRAVQGIFGLRRCKTLGKKTCLYCQIGQCLAPCTGERDTAYQKETAALTDFLRGDYGTLSADLQARMAEAAQVMDYEGAAHCRDKLQALDRVMTTQTVVAPDQLSRDVWGFAAGQNIWAAVLLRTQNGRIIGSRSFSASSARALTDDALERLLLRFYDEEPVPTEIILPPDGALGLPADWADARQVKIWRPQSGFRHDFVRMGIYNARKYLQERIMSQLREASPADGLKRLQEILKMEALPRRIECYDISHIQGSETVASQAVLIDGLPGKSEYRKYIINQDHPDDFASMEEVLTRRCMRLDDGNRPDLVVIDGGKGQLGVAVRVWQNFQLSIPLCALAKREEEVFVPRRSEPLVLPRRDAGLRLLQTVRDEAHRFAVSFHRLRRKKRTLNTK
ncbi:excinuclease ABC subunit C [Candidatus Termititenax persephonae]|uniref:UvrABC system protein C n=1 Tax=Candidatus Termititenax persephonae TaxID=2218525 RepID=A0A388TH79_9BACT|nr:excinuclease ABC subunit C [Candidatus Termititenax persephonae]